MSTTRKNIRGAGGGGETAPRAPIEAPDSLRSKQYARVLDLISEGEIEGLVNGTMSVFLNDVPVQNLDGTYNFKEVTLLTRNGTQTQEYLPGIPEVEVETSVGAEVKFSIPVVRTLNNTALTGARVTIGIPTLTEQNTTTGDLNGSKVELAVDLQSNGGGFVPQLIGRKWTGETINSYTYTAIQSYGIGIRVFASGAPRYFGEGITFRVEYKLVSDSSWIVLRTDTFTYQDIIYPYQIPDSPAVYAVLRDYYTQVAPLGDYQIRVVVIKNVGSWTNTTGTIGYRASEAYTDVVVGKTTSRYQRSYNIPLVGSPPWDIRIRRITADSDSVSIQNKTYWDSYTEIVDAKLNYPNSALCSVQLDSSQFNSIPTRGYEIKGLRIKIPSNYDPLARTYTGVWDGTFIVAWSNNPAWCYYDLVTNPRYGLGAFLSGNQIDKWALYTIAQYCDELVDDGFGNLEPRFTCNLYLQTAAEAYTVLVNFASIFRAMTWWGAGTIILGQDSPMDPIAQYTTANVIDGVFSYSGSSRTVRHTIALIGWNDPDRNYEMQIEYVEDREGIAKYGAITKNVVAMGCTSRGQAHRLGRWLLYSERLETEVVTFNTGLDGAFVYPGAIIQTVDPFRSGKRFGGRVTSATSNAVNIDSPVTIEVGKTYQLICQLSDGTIETRSTTNSVGDTSTLNVMPEFSSAPQDQSIWLLSASDLIPETWRIISAREVSKGQIEVSALEYNPNKFVAIEQDIILERPSTTSISTIPTPVLDLKVTESLYLAALGVVGVKAQISWQSSFPEFMVAYRAQNENWIELTVRDTSVEILGLSSGIYEFSVTAFNVVGIRSASTILTQEIFGKLLVPVDVTNLSVIKVSGFAQAQWDLHPDLDVQVGGSIVIRHSLLTSGATWNDGYILDEFTGDTVNGVLPLISGTYMIKAVDSGGRYSTNATSFVATEGMVTGFNTAATSTQAPTFSGAKTNVAVNSNILHLDSVTLIDAITDLIDTWLSIDSVGGLNLTGSYAFDNYIDLTTVATRRFEADIAVLYSDLATIIDSRSDLIDTWGSFDGGVINGCDVTLYAATTNDDPAGTPVWGPWTPFFVSDFTCRAVKFKLDFLSDSIYHDINISTLTVHIKVPV